MKRFFLLSALLLGTLITWADDNSPIVYSDCDQDTLRGYFPSTLDTMAHWMEFFPDNTPLFDLVIPGSHESVTWYYEGTEDRHIKDQVLDYKDTWDLGARAFDLRLAFEACHALSTEGIDYTKYTYFHHGDNRSAVSVGLGPMNIVTDDVANHFPTTDQLENECMILFAKKEFMDCIYTPGYDGQEECNPTDPYKVFEVLMSCLLDKYGADRFIAFRPGMTLGESRGKILMFVQNDFDTAYTQVPINYAPDYRDDWDIKKCVETPVSITTYENGVRIQEYTNNYTQNIYDLGSSDSLLSGINHKIEAICALASREPSNGMEFCANFWNCFFWGTFLPYLWQGTGAINMNIASMLTSKNLNARGVHLIDFYGVDSYSDESFSGYQAARELVRHNFRIHQSGINIKLNAEGCDTYNEYTYGSIMNADITAEHQTGRYFSQWSDDNLDNPRSIWVSQDSTFTAWYNHVRLFSDDSKNGITYNFTGRDCSTDDCSDAKTVTLATSFGSSTNTILFVDDAITATVDFTVPETTISTHYGGWDDGVWGSHRVFTAYSDTTFTAIFGDNIADVCFNDWHHYNFTNDSLGLGSYIEYAVVGNGQGAIVYFADSAIITAKARPSRGVHFDHWGDNGSTDPTRTDLFTEKYGQIELYFAENKVHTSRVCLSADTTINFTDPTCDQPNLCQTHTLTLNTTYCDRNTYVQFTDSDDIKLYADETDEYRFYQWSDGNTDNPRMVSVGSDTTFTAVYAYQAPIFSNCEQDTLTINYIGRDGAHSEGGDTRTITLYCDSCDNAQHVTVQVHDGDVVVLDPVNDPAYHFVCWNDSVTDNPRVVTATSDMSFSATFAENLISLYQTDSLNTPVYDFTGNRHSSDRDRFSLLLVSAHDTRDSIYYTDELTVIVTVVPDEGYIFAGWTDGNIDNPRRISLYDMRYYEAVFSNNNTYVYQDCAKNGRTYQFKSTPAEDHPYVDLGLPSGNLWARMNIGARSPEDYGETYAWGDTRPNPSGERNDYRWSDHNGKLTKYCSDSQYGKVDNVTTLDDADDAAKSMWKNDWRMPTKGELEELRDHCSWSNQTINGIPCRVGKGQSGDSIILPQMQGNDTYIGNYQSCEKQGVSDDWRNWALYLREKSTEYDLTMQDTYRYWNNAAIRPVRGRLDQTITGSVYADGCETANTVIGSPNEEINIMAVPMPGYRFLQWSDSVTDNHRLVTLTDGMSMTAQFAADNQIFWDCSQNGNHYNYHHSGADAVTLTLRADSCEHANEYVLNQGDSICITAVAPNGVRFVQWSDSVTDNPRWIRLNSDTTFYAQFELQSPDIFISSDDSKNGKEYNYYTPRDAGHEFVDLGLPRHTKWATTNIGTTSPEQVGDAFAWAEVDAKCAYEWMNYMWAYESSGQLKKYYEVDHKITIEDDDDAARFNWGDSWRMPSKDDVQELLDNCVIEVDSLNGVAGHRVTGPNKNSMFIPYSTEVDNSGVNHMFWLADIYRPDDSEDYLYSEARTLGGYSGGALQMFKHERAYGLPLRAIYEGDVHFRTITLGNSNGKKINTFHIDDDIPEVVIRADVEDGYRFVRWSDGNTDNPRVLKLEEDVELTTEFALNEIIVSQNCADTTIISLPTVDCPLGDCDSLNILTMQVTGCDRIDTIRFAGQLITTLTAIADEGCVFAGWSDGNADSSRIVTLSSDTAFVATFYLGISDSIYQDCSLNGKTYDYCTTKTDIRRILLYADSCAVADTILVNRGAILTTTAVPQPGYDFARWSDGVSVNPRVDTVSTDTTFIARYRRFEMPIYSDCYNSGDTVHFVPETCYNGTDCNVMLAKIYASDCGVSYKFDFSDSIIINLMPLPNINKHFVQWEDGSLDNPRLITAKTDTTYGVRYDLNEIDLFRNGQYNDTIYDFTNHLCISADSARLHTITVRCKDTDIVLSALFVDSCQITLSAIPGLGYRFVQWSDGDTVPTRTETLYADTTFTAEIEKEDIVIYQDCDHNGGLCDYRTSEQDVKTILLSADDCQIMDTVLINSGDQMTIRAEANQGYEFMQWSDGVTDNPRVLSINTDTLITAQFFIHIPITITADSVEKIIGASDSLSWHISEGKLNPGDTLASISLIRDPGEDPGNYTIHVAVVDSLNPTYRITTVDGNMRIYNGEHRMPKEATALATGYDREHWLNTENGLYYADGNMNEMIADSVPLTTYLMDPNICTYQRDFEIGQDYEVEGYTFPFIAHTVFSESGDIFPKITDFTVLHANVSQTRMMWYKNYPDYNYGKFTITVLINDIAVDTVEQGETYIGGFYAIPLSGLKQNDVVRFLIERKQPAALNAPVTFAALLQYTQSPEGVTGMETVDSAKGKQQSVKFIQDNQLFILRDDKLYNAQGILMSTH